MSKTISKYRAYTASDIKTRADVPLQVNMTVSGNDILCDNINTTVVRNALGESTSKISELCTSTLINQWSGFSPYTRVVSTPGVGGTLVNSLPIENFKIGDFAGYNHTAATPGWVDKSEVEIDQWIVSGNAATVSSQIIIGEVRWQEDLPSNGIVGVAFAVYEVGSGTLKGYVIYDIETFTDTVDFDLVTDPINTETSCELKAFFVDDLVTLDSGTIVLPVPNVTTANFIIKIKEATVLIVEEGWNQTYEFLNLTTGVVTVNGAYKDQSYTNLTVYANLYNWLNENVGSVVLFDGAYTANDILNMSGQVTTNIPIDSYGYRCEVSFEVSI